MSPSERLGWYFLLIPLAGYAAALFVTNAFFNRYFLGMLPGVAIAFACALWRHFHQRPGVSAGIVLIMLFMGVGHQVTAMAKPRAINPPSNGGGAARLSELMAWESIMAKDGKKNLAVPADRLIDVEARYYSKYPERYASVLTPGMGVIAQVHRNFAPFPPVRFWNLEDLRAAARDTALIEPSDELLKAVANAGIQVRPLATEKIKLFYLE
jgi:hypothetical protein